MKRIKKPKIAKYFVLLLLIIMMAMTCKTTSNADAGDLNSYDGGGYSSGGSSSDGWSSGYYDSYSSSSDDSMEAPSVVYGVVIGYILLMSVINYIKRENDDVARNNKNKAYRNKNIQVENSIKQHDEYFCSADLIAHTKQVFVNYQYAWSKRNLEPVRAQLDKNLFDQTNSQIKVKIADGIVNKLERVTVTDAFITDYWKGLEKENVTIYLKALMVDYQIRESTGNVIIGDPSVLYKLEYNITMARRLGSKTPKDENDIIHYNCPDCGAPLNTMTYGKCEYCGAIINGSGCSWLFSAISKA